jgi:hypothetical protein
MVDGAARATGLALRDLPSAAGRDGALGRSRDGGRGTTDRPAVSDPSRRWVAVIRCNSRGAASWHDGTCERGGNAMTFAPPRSAPRILPRNRQMQIS